MSAAALLTLLTLVALDVFAAMPAETRAARRAEDACVAGNADACRRWTGLYGHGVVAPADEKRVLARFLKACDGRKAAACSAAAAILDLGRGDDKGAEALYDRACNGGDGEGCVTLGDKRARAAAVKAYRRACDLGVYRGCTAAALQLASGSDGVPADPMEAARLLYLACQHGEDSACQLIRDAQR